MALALYRGPGRPVSGGGPDATRRREPHRHGEQFATDDMSLKEGQIIMIRCIVLALICVAMVVPSSFAQSSVGHSAQAFDSTNASYVLNALHPYNLRGIALSNISDGEIVISPGHGLAGTDTDEDTIVRLIPKMASVFKLVTVTAVIRSVEKGKMCLSGVVSKCARFVTHSVPRYVKMTIRYVSSDACGMLEVAKAGLCL